MVPARELPVACVQSAHRPSLDATLKGVEGQVAEAAAAGAELVLLPEYFYLPMGTRATPETAGNGTFDAVVPFLERVSREHDVALAGTAPLLEDGRLYNACHLLDAGELVGIQRKIHPMPREAEHGVAGATELSTFDLRGIRVGVAVCADVLYPEVPRILSLRGAEVILVPVMSPYRGDDEADPTRRAREALFVARAFDAAAYVLKAGGFSNPDHGVVGRSFIAAPWGLLAHYRDPWSPEVLHAQLDMDRIRTMRQGFLPLERRAPWAYGSLADPDLLPTTLPHPDGAPRS